MRYSGLQFPKRQLHFVVLLLKDSKYTALHYANCIAYIYHRVVVGHLISVCSWQYASKNDLQVCTCAVFEGHMFICAKVTDVSVWLYVLTYVLLIALLKPDREHWVAIL